MEAGFDSQIKVLLAGGPCSGKTSLLLRVADDTFSESYISTTGVDVKSKIINVGGKVVKTEVWDIPGEERFKTMAIDYYKSANVIILVFDVTNLESFENL